MPPPLPRCRDLQECRWGTLTWGDLLSLCGPVSSGMLGS